MPAQLASWDRDSDRMASSNHGEFIDTCMNTSFAPSNQASEEVYGFVSYLHQYSQVCKAGEVAQLCWKSPCQLAGIQLPERICEQCEQKWSGDITRRTKIEEPLIMHWPNQDMWGCSNTKIPHDVTEYHYMQSQTINGVNADTSWTGTWSPFISWCRLCNRSMFHWGYQSARGLYPACRVLDPRGKCNLQEQMSSKFAYKTRGLEDYHPANWPIWVRTNG